MKANLQGKDAKKATAKESKRKINPRYDGMKRVFDKLRKRRNG